MTQREASIKLSMKTGSFKNDVRSAEKEVEKSGSRMGKALKKHLGAGLGAAKQSLSQFGGQLKSALSTAATLGGAIGFGAFAKNALDAEQAAGKIAQRLRRMGEEGSSIQQVLDLATGKAGQFNTTMGTMIEGYENLLAATADPVFSREALESVAMFSDAFRISGDQAATLVNVFNRKLGASAEEIKTKFGPALLDVVNKGGASIDDLVQNGDRLLSVLKSSGLEGADGFSKVLGIINATDSAGGTFSERMSQLKQILVRVKSQNFIEQVSKSVKGLNPKDFDRNADSIENLQTILSREGGLEALEKVFGASPETANLFATIAEPFKNAREDAIKSGAKAQQARLNGIEAFNGSLAEISKTTATEADLRDEAAKRQAETSRKFEQALDRMKQKFVDERFLKSMERLGDILPVIADKFSDLMEFALENPKTAVAAAVGAQVLPTALAATAGSALTGAGGAIAAKLGIGGAATAAGAAGATGAAGAAGAGAAGTGAAGAAAGGAALTAASVAAAGAAGFFGTKLLLGKGGDKALKDAGGAGFGGITGAELALNTNDSKALAQARRNLENESSFLTDAIGGIVSLVSDEQTARERRQALLEKISKKEADLAEQMEKRKRAEQMMIAMVERSASAFGKLSQSVSGSTRGPIAPPAVVPGAAPVGG